jgi:maleylacetoacetate isomerase
MIACDIHPLNNLRVLQQLRQQFNATEPQVTEWYHHWLTLGFCAIEKKLTKLPRSKNVCYGKNISLADLCLIPQVYNAKRFDFPMDHYPLISEINEFCLSNSAFVTAKP